MKIAVVGSINMDMSVHAERIPAAGETLLGDKLSYAPGGKGANQAYAIARFGAEVSMFGCTGEDENGKILIENLKNSGVDTRFIHRVKEEPTGLAVITIGSGDNTIIVIPGANRCVTREYIDKVEQEILAHDIILLQQEIPMETVSYVIGLCRRHSKIIILNPAPAAVLAADVVGKADYITPNEHEAEIIFAGSGRTDVMENMRAYPGKLIVTMGARGAAVCSGGEIRMIAARKAAAVDTTGAGDTFNGIFAAMLAEGSPVEKALLYANAGASLSTEKMGAQGGMPLRSQVENEIKAIAYEH